MEFIFPFRENGFHYSLFGCTLLDHVVRLMLLQPPKLQLLGDRLVQVDQGLYSLSHADVVPAPTAESRPH